MKQTGKAVDPVSVFLSASPALNNQIVLSSSHGFLKLLRAPADFSGMQTEPVGGFPPVLEMGLQEKCSFLFNGAAPCYQALPARQARNCFNKKVGVWFRRIQITRAALAADFSAAEQKHAGCHQGIEHRA